MTSCNHADKDDSALMNRNDKENVNGMAATNSSNCQEQSASTQASMTSCGDDDEATASRNVTLQQIHIGVGLIDNNAATEASSSAAESDNDGAAANNNHDLDMEAGSEQGADDQQDVFPTQQRRQVSLSEASDYNEEYYDDEESDDYDDYDDLSYASSQDSSYEYSSDDESSSEGDLQRQPSVIAIGVPAARAAQHEEKKQEEQAASQRFKTADEEDQEAVSEAVAKDIAETEHVAKQKAQDTSQHEMVPRKSAKKKKKPDSLDDDKSSKENAELKRRTSLRTLEHVPPTRSFPPSDRVRLAAAIPEKSELVDGESNVYGTGNGLDDDEESELEAQAGIPVVMPGAYAMDGIDADLERNMTGYDSGFDNSVDSEEEEAERPSTTQEPELPPVQLEAELLQETPQMLVDGQALPVEEEVKMPLRARLLRGGLLVGVFVAVGVIVGLVISFLGGGSSNAQNGDPMIGWEILGEPLADQANKDNSYFGSAVSLSGDASRLLVAMPGWDESPSRLDIGQALVYDWNGESWEQVGQQIIGPGPQSNTQFALSQIVALSKDGTRIAFASPLWGGGQVAILQEPTNATGRWTLLGQNLTGQVGEDGRFGYAVDFSANGTIVAVGSPLVDNDISGIDAGVVRIFQEQNNSTWEQLGQDIVGEGELEVSGWSVALSADGSRVAVGSPGSGQFTGIVRTFFFNGAAWVQLGQSLDGAAQDRFGHSVSLSDDGSILAIGGWEYSESGNREDVGHVRIYNYMQDEWVQLGDELVGVNPYDNFGYSVSLSASGLQVAIGSPRNTDFLSDMRNQIGSMTVYDLDPSGQWKQREGVILGTSAYDNLGHSVALAADGGRVAGGAPFARYDGKFDNVGKVAVFEPIGE